MQILHMVLVFDLTNSSRREAKKITEKDGAKIHEESGKNLEEIRRQQS